MASDRIPYDVVEVELDDVGTVTVAPSGVDVENVTVLKLPGAALDNVELKLHPEGKWIPLELIGQPFVWLARPHRRGVQCRVQIAAPGEKVVFFVGFAEHEGGAGVEVRR